MGLLKDEAGLRRTLQDGPLKASPDLDALKTKMQRKKAGLAEVIVRWRLFVVVVVLLVCIVRKIESNSRVRFL